MNSSKNSIENVAYKLDEALEAARIIVEYFDALDRNLSKSEWNIYKVSYDWLNCI